MESPNGNAKELREESPPEKQYAADTKAKTRASRTHRRTISTANWQRPRASLQSLPVRLPPICRLTPLKPASFHCLMFDFEGGNLARVWVVPFPGFRAFFGFLISGLLGLE